MHRLNNGILLSICLRLQRKIIILSVINFSFPDPSYKVFLKRQKNKLKIICELGFMTPFIAGVPPEVWAMAPSLSVSLDVWL